MNMKNPIYYLLTIELAAINRLAANAGAVGEVTTLDHEVRNDSVKLGTLIVKGLSASTQTLLAGAKSSEVLSSLGDGLAEEAHNDTAGSLASDLDVEEDLAGDSLKVLAKRDGGNQKHRQTQTGEGNHIASC